MHERVKHHLEHHQAAYKVHFHKDLPFPISSPRDFAAALGYELKRISKTLLLHDERGPSYYVIVLSCDRKVDLKMVADSIGCGRLELASRRELEQLLGYPPQGVSPFGVRGIQVMMDQALLELPSVLVGAGEGGVEVEVSPHKLQEITQAITLELSSRDSGISNERDKL